MIRTLIKRYCNHYNPLIEIEKMNINQKINNFPIFNEICKNINHNPLLETEKINSHICKINCKNLSKCKNIKDDDNPLRK